ncbi:MAG: flavin reductase family protein [Emcibacteraceae bacterium]|nr:flavin reductase family protein [Emcibacteraceae bacterium]
MNIQNDITKKDVSERLSDSKYLRNLFGNFASGVTVISSRYEEKIHGMTANSFVSVSIDPPLALISVARSAKMHSVLQQSGNFGISILGHDQQHVATHFAGKPDLNYEADFIQKKAEVPILNGAIAWMACTVKECFDVGDHTLFIGKLIDCEYLHGGTPLVYCNGKFAVISQ